MKNIRGLKQYRVFKKRFLVKAAKKIQKMRKIFAEQVGIGEHLTRKQQYQAMELDDIPEPLEWPIESWPLTRLFWQKSNLSACLDAWAKCDLLLLNKSNPLQDSEVLDYQKHHNPMQQYFSNSRNIQT